jgi:DNA-binding CsgD family transcriptional regulator/cell division protein FtsL
MKQEIYKAEIDFEIRKNELELEKNISAENAKKWFNYFFILLVGSLIIIAMLYYSRLTIEREMAQKSFESLEKEYKNITLSNIKLNQEIEFKSRELANHTLNMVHRNNLLREIKENLLGLRKEQEFQKNEKLQSIINYVNHCLNQEKDWMIFKSQFDNLNKAFFDNLQKNYPNLTQQELKLCALIKLNLSVKETSSILGISPESVKVTKYRLKKKLNLKPEQNFSAALNMFVNVSDENN